MIAWSIDVAMASGLFSKVVVSTDDDEIADVAQSFGADVPFIRPSELSDDMTTTAPVIAHAITECNKLGWTSEFVCCLYSCAPFIVPNDLTDALDLLMRSGSEFSYPVVEYSHPIQRALLRSEKGVMTFQQPEYELSRTQDLPVTYHDAGQFYWGRTDAWLRGEHMHSGGAGLIVPSWRSVDIDTNDDWKLAEYIFGLINEQENT